jgi:hypothetical protein
MLVDEALLRSGADTIAANWPPMSDGLKDALQAAAWVAAAVGLALTAFKFLAESRQAREQRRNELRWRQAQAGKDLNDEMQDNPLAWTAMRILDSDGRAFDLPGGKRVRIRDKHIVRAFDCEHIEIDPVSTYLRDCFDNLFYYMAMIEHYTTSGLIHADDTAYPLEYYIPLLAQFRGPVNGYLEKYRLTRTLRFLDRFPAWRNQRRG